MQKRKWKLVSFGGEHTSGRRIFRTPNGKGWVLSSKPIDWVKVASYGIVIAFIMGIMAFLIKYASEPNGEGDIIEPMTATQIHESKNMKATESYPHTLKLATAPVQIKLKQDIIIELSSMKQHRSNETKVEVEAQEQKTAVEVVATVEPLAYTTEFSAATEERIRTAMEIIVGSGFTPEGSAAIVGNALVESQLLPKAANGTDYFGLFQWSSSWWEHIKVWLLDNGYDIYSFEGQIHAAIECQEDGCMTEEWWAKLKEMQNVDKATELFAIFYEGCIGGTDPTEYYSKGTCYQALTLRKAEAKQALGVYYGEGYSGSKPYYP